MNSYPSWWDKTLTIYNKKVDPETQRVTWYRHTVDNCFWKYNNARMYSLGNRMVVASNLYEIKEVICRIPKDDRFIDEQAWLDTENVENHFTLNTGDIIIEGDVDDTIDEYTKGQRSTDLLTKYKRPNRCIQIEGYVIDTGIGRCCEHYNIQGA